MKAKGLLLLAVLAGAGAIVWLLTRDRGDGLPGASSDGPRPVAPAPEPDERPLELRAPVGGGGERPARGPAERPEAAGAIAGRVVDDGGRPVEAAVIETEATWALTAADGTFVLDETGAGSSRLFATAEGYDPAEVEVAVPENGRLELPEPLVLTALPGVTGRVFGAAGEPLADAIVHPAGADLFAMQKSSRTDEGGRWHLGADGPQDLEVAIRHPEHLPHRLKIHHSGARTVAPDVRLARGAVITGRVVDEAGAPVEGARGFALDPEEFGLMFGVDVEQFSRPEQGEKGVYRVAGLATGSVQLFVSAPGFLPFRKEDVRVVAPETTTLDVTLSRGRSIGGVVTGPDGAPIAGASIHAYSESEPVDVTTALLSGAMDASATSDDQGRFTLTGFDEGTVGIEVRADGYAPASHSGIEPGATDLTIRLVRAGAIVGRVVDDATGEPVGKAQVTAGMQAVLAAADGTFRIDGLAPGRHSVIVESEEHVPWSESGVEVPEGGDSAPVEVRLAAGHRLPVLVVRAADGTPLSGARVRVSGPLNRSAETAEAGRALLAGLPSGPVDVEASAEGLARARTRASLPATAELRLELSAGGSVRGVVLDAEGRGRAGLMISLSESGQDFGGISTQTDAEGRFLVENVPPGTLTLLVLSFGGGEMGMDMQTERVEVEEGRETFVTIGGPDEVGKKTTLAGRLLDGGKPLAGRQIVLLSLDEEATPLAGMKMASTDASGRFDLKGLSKGRYVLIVAGGGGPDFASGGVVEIGPDGGVLERDVSLPAGRIAGRVLDADGRPVADAKLLVLDPARLARPPAGFADMIAVLKAQAQTDKEGRFELKNVEPGSWRLAAFDEERRFSILDGVTVSEAGGAEASLKIGRTYAVDVRIVSASGEPVPGARAALFDAGGRWMPLGSELALPSDSDGRATFRLPTGRWSVLVGADGMAPARATIDVSGDRDAEVRLTPGGTIDLAVAGSAAGARVRIFTAAGEIAPVVDRDLMMAGAGLPRVGADGRAELTHVPAGEVRLRVETTDGRTAETTATVPEGGRVAATLKLP